MQASITRTLTPGNDANKTCLNWKYLFFPFFYSLNMFHFCSC